MTYILLGAVLTAPIPDKVPTSWMSKSPSMSWTLTQPCLDTVFTQLQTDIPRYSPLFLSLRSTG